MEGNSLFDLARDIERQIGSILAGQDISQAPSEQKKTIEGLQRALTDARLDTRDYQYAETMAEQVKAGQASRRRWHQVQQGILKASEYTVFGPADVAQLSAHIERIISRMR